MRISRAVSATVLLAVCAIAPSAAELRLGLEGLYGFPLLPDIYESSARRFGGLTVAFPVLPALDVRAGAAWGGRYSDGPYNDVTNYASDAHLFKLEAVWTAFRAGPARFLLAAGADRLSTSWRADDLAYETPYEPEEDWEGRLTRWAVHAAPGIELFREKQAVDWTIAVSLPIYLALGADVADSGGDDDRRFRKAYLDDAGMGFSFSIGLGLGTGR